jgi:lysophospholipase L1-like esterase
MQATPLDTRKPQCMVGDPILPDCAPRLSALPLGMRRLFSLIGFALLAVTAWATPDKWSGEIEKLVAADASQRPAPGGVVFVGSSSIRLWTSLAQDFPGINALNRGFGGSELADSVFYADRIVVPYAPRTVVLYAGENDLAAGKSAETVLADFRAFRTKVHAALPMTRILFLSIKASPSRAKVLPAVKRANELIAADCATDPRCTFVDVATPLLDAQGSYRPELFRDDQLHLKPAGYEIWTKVLAPYLKP